MFSKFLVLLVFGSVLVPMCTTAQIAEVRVGIAEFDEMTLNIPAGGVANENSVALSGEILFKEPESLKWALSPQPYIGGSINLEGKTSFGGAGLLWRQNFNDKFYGDISLGLVAHNGTLEVIPSAELLALFAQNDLTPEDITVEDMALLDAFTTRRENEIEFGSRILFRQQVALGYDVDEHWAGEVYYEHLSNGGIFSNTNDGVNILGARAVRKF